MVFDLLQLHIESIRYVIEHEQEHVRAPFLFALDEDEDIHAIPAQDMMFARSLLRQENALLYVTAWEREDQIFIAYVERGYPPKFKVAHIFFKGADRVLGEFLPVIGVSAAIPTDW